MGHRASPHGSAYGLRFRPNVRATPGRMTEPAAVQFLTMALTPNTSAVI
jgi:hypothetical protein